MRCAPLARIDSGFGALILIHWRGRDRILLGEVRVIVRQSVVGDANVIKWGTPAFTGAGM